MTEPELRQTLARGEDGQHQFKRDVTNADALAAELIAFANSGGGKLFIGVADNGQVAGLKASDVTRINQLLSNAASQNVRPPVNPVNPVSNNVQTGTGIVIIVKIDEGLNKPYVDTQGRIWVKSGADKRHVTAREEMQRLFQTAGLVYADEVPARPATIDDLDAPAFDGYFKRRYGKTLESTDLPLLRLLNNLNLARDGVPNLAGLLLFGKAPQLIKPAFTLKAAAFPGTVLHDNHYLDSETLEGPLTELYQRGMAFIKRNLRHVQSGPSFNSPSRLEVPEIVFEELLVNALVHRDYFISAPIRLLIFTDRIEIISPGHLPNHLDTEQIRYGLSNLRNPALASHAFHMLPYHGLGSGIPRVTLAWKEVELIDDRRGNQFKAVVRRQAVSEGSQAELLAIKEPLRSHSGPGRDQVGTRLDLDPEQLTVMARMQGEHAISELMTWVNRSNRSKFRDQVLTPLLSLGLVEMTVPDKPSSRLQKYRLTHEGDVLQDTIAARHQ